MPSANQLKGYHRDNAVLEAIHACKALDTEQVRVLLFTGQKHSRRKAQERLQRLHSLGKVNRWRPGPEHPYIYYPDKKHGRIEHLVMLNWVYCWTARGLQSWEKIYRWDYEQNYGILQCDAFATVKNTVTGKLVFGFVELDRAESGNTFDKVKKYCDLYEAGGYEKWWWVDLADKFPEIVIVTTSLARERSIRFLIQKENRCNLRFKVFQLDEIKKEAMEI